MIVPVYNKPVTHPSSDHYKCGQASRSVVGDADIQTSCNLKANLRDRCYLLDCVRCLFSNEML